MKKAILIISLFTSMFSNAQTDYTASRSDNFINGVYIFVMSTPTNEYDFIASTKSFDILEEDDAKLKKIIDKLKKKNPSFDGIIFRRNSTLIDLVKFKSREEVLQGFRVGQEVTFKHLGLKKKGTILYLQDKKNKDKAVIEWVDKNGVTHKLSIPMKDINR